MHTIDKHSLDKLVECGLLTPADVQRLRDAGIHDGPALVVAWRQEVEQYGLEQETGLSRDQLIKATLVANMLSLDGPGAVTAEQEVMSTKWSNVPEYPDNQEIFNLVTAQRTDLLEYFGQRGFARKEKEQRTFRNSFFLKSVKFTLPLMLIILGLVLFPFRDSLLSKLFGDIPSDLPAQWDWAVDRLILGGGAVFLTLLLLGLSGVISLLYDLILPRFERWVDLQGGVNTRSKLLLNDALLLQPDREQRLTLLLRFYPLLMLVVPILVLSYQLRGIAIDWTQVRHLSIWTMAVGLSVMSVLGVYMNHRALKRQTQAWYEQARPAHLAVTLAKQDFVLVLIFVTFIIGMFGMKSITSLLVSGLEVGMLDIQHSFQIQISQQISGPQEQIALQQTLAQFFRNELSDIYLSENLVDAIWQDLFPVAVWNIYLLSVILSGTIYLLINAKKGPKGLVIFTLLWLMDQLLPEWIAQWLGTGMIEIRISLLGLAVMYLWQLNRDVLNIVGEHRDDQECPTCYMLTQNKRICQYCEHAIPPTEQKQGFSFNNHR